MPLRECLSRELQSLKELQSSRSNLRQTVRDPFPNARHAVNSRWLLIARGIHGHKPAAKKAEPWTAEAERSLRSLRTLPAIRSFTNTARALKKGGKAAREEKQQSGRKESDGASEDPYDFSNLEADIASALERLKNDLSKLRAGGRFNPEVLENLRVQVEKGSSKTVKLSDVAQIVPKGRTVQVIVGEKDHVKPVSSAIQGSTLSLTPQPDPTGANPLLLVVNIPPPTADSRRAAVAEAAKAGDKASTAVRDARGKQQKKLRALQLAKSARPDDLKKAGTQMEKVVEKGSAEVKKVVDSAKKVLESG